MSSNIPTRRITRASQRSDENALRGRPLTTRANTKAGALSSVAALAPGPSKPNAASDAITQHKRKREALGEVTNNSRNKNTAPKVPAKTSTNVVKPEVVIPTRAVRPTAKAPPRKTRVDSVTSITTAIPDKKKKDVRRTESSTVVDAPGPTLYRVARKIVSTTTTVEAGARVKGTSLPKTIQEEPEEPEEPEDDTEAETEEEEAEAEAEIEERVFKKRRTSSEGDVEAAVESIEDYQPDEEQDFVANEVNKAAPANPNDILGQDTEAEAIDEEEAEDEEAENSEAEVTGWDDLDAKDADDPYMVSEYVVDIFQYLSQCEDETLPSPDYMYHQKELSWKHRGILMDYLIGIHYRFKLAPETLYLLTNIIDRFLSIRVVSISKLHLVGMASLFIASKFEDIMSPSVSNLAHISNGEVQEDDLLKAERYILKALDYKISNYPQPMNWLRRVSKADGYNHDVRAVAKFFLEIHVVEKKLVGIKPSLLAAASIWLGRLTLGTFDWTPNLAHYSGYSESKIIPVANVMLNYCLRTEKHQNFVQKYSTKKYSKVAVYVHDWVTSRWTLGEKVSLQDELQYLMTLGTEREEEE